MKLGVKHTQPHFKGGTMISLEDGQSSPTQPSHPPVTNDTTHCRGRKGMELIAFSSDYGRWRVRGENYRAVNVEEISYGEKCDN